MQDGPRRAGRAAPVPRARLTSWSAWKASTPAISTWRRRRCTCTPSRWRSSSGAGGAFDIDSFSEEVLARLDRLPPFRRRVLNVPFRLNHPVWVADRPLDMSRHIVHQALPKPAGDEGARGPVGRIISVPLDRDIPWELHLVEGLEGAGSLVAKRTTHWRTGTPPTTCSPTSPVRAARTAAAARADADEDAAHRRRGQGLREAALLAAELLRRTATNVTALVKIRRGSDVTPPADLDVPARRSTPPSARAATSPPARSRSTSSRRSSARTASPSTTSSWAWSAVRCDAGWTSAASGPRLADRRRPGRHRRPGAGRG